MQLTRDTLGARGIRGTFCMKNVIPIYKSLGATPYQSVLEFKQRFPEYRDRKISYAGRLDPMAEGLLLLLIDEENKKRNTYEKLQKTYEFTVLLGIETDTYDILGKIVNFSSSSFHLKTIVEIDKSKNGRSMKNDKWQMENILRTFVGKYQQPYPPYSSKAVSGRPLYWWARNQKLDQVQIPSHEIEIYSFELISRHGITIQDVKSRIQENIGKVQGDFRQEEILKVWEDFFARTNHAEFPVLNCRIVCSSGTYVRGIAHEIGQNLDCGAIAISIKRTSIGEFNISSIIKA